jgi:putative transcriptional regulator
VNFTSEPVVSMIVNKLRELREAKMKASDESEIWTQEGLAKRLGVTRQTIISMEKGTYNPSLTLAFKLANLFDAKIEDIFEFRGDEIES